MYAGGLVVSILAGLVVLDVVIEQMRAWGERMRERDRIALRRELARRGEAPRWQR
jgi:hypothetical protein